MALSAELKLRLEAGEPLPKRLKLAENAYCSTDLVINRKEDMVLEWLCNISHSGHEAWNSLSLCIHCISPNRRATLSCKTRTKLVDTLTNELKVIQVGSPPDSVLNFCNEILLNTEMQQYFQTKINKFGSLLKHIFLSLKSDQADNKSLISNVAHTCILNAIEVLVKIYKQVTDKDKLTETFLNHILSSLCALIDPNYKDNTNRIGAEAHKCMQQILFGKGRHAEYIEYFNRNESGGLPAILFRTITEHTSKIHSDHSSDMINYLFRAAAGSYKADSTLIDNLFRKFVNCSGDFKTDVLSSLIEYLADIHLDYANKVDDISLTQFFANSIDEILNKEDFSAKEYSLLRNITALNPLISENKFQIIFKKVLLMRRETEAEKRAYVLLIIGIVTASSRLRREQKLIPWLLLALHEALRENKDCSSSADQILPLEFISELNHFASRLNSSQILPILSSLTFHLKSNCVEEYEEDSKNHVSLMAECTVTLLIAFLQGIQIVEHTVPLATQQKLARSGLGQLGDVLSCLAKKILNRKHNGRIMVVLFKAVSSWRQVQCLLDHYVPQSEAGNLSLPISDDELQQLIQRAEHFGDQDCRNVVNRYLFDQIKINHDPHKRPEKLTGFIGKPEDCWTIILNDYRDLVSLLDFDQLSSLASFILTDIITHRFDNWKKTFMEESIQENTKFIIAILCHALIKIGSIIKGSTTAAITARINPTKILADITESATVPALNRKKLIRDIVQWRNLTKEDSDTIGKMLETLLSTPLTHLSIPLRTMTFVIVYVIAKECEKDERIKDLTEKILFDTMELGGLNVFEFIDINSLVPHLQENSLFQKVFNMSLRNADDSAASEYIASLDSCPIEAVPALLVCTETVKSKLNNVQRVALGKLEKKLGKKLLSTDEKDINSSQKIRGFIVTLRNAIANNKVKDNFKNSIRFMLELIFVEEVDEDEDKENLTDFNDKVEQIKAALELAAIALQHRTQFDFSEALVSAIWTKVLKYPDGKILKPILEASVPKVFNTVLTVLQSQTEEELREDNIEKLINTLKIWNCIFMSDMGTVRNKLRLSATRKLLQSLLTADVYPEHWLELIKLVVTIIITKHMEPSGEHIDMIILIAARPLRERNWLVYNEVLILCLGLLRSRVGLITDRLPTLLQLYKEAISHIAIQSRINNTIDRHQLALCSLNIEKVTTALVKLKKDVRRVSPFIISDLINELAQGELEGPIKESFKNCHNSLFSICDKHLVSYLSRVLPPSGHEIFKGLIESYNKFHRFTGKI